MSSRALGAAVAVAEEHGLRFDGAVVLQDRSNLLVRLDPLPVVARVPAVTGQVRKSNDWLAREVAVAGHLARAGAPVVPPSSLLPPGPHDRDGVTVSFFEWVGEVDAPLDAREAGRRLRECHEALVDFDGELPVLGLLHEADAMFGQTEQRGDAPTGCCGLGGRRGAGASSAGGAR